MAIYDNNGTTNAEIGKLYDNDGTTNYQIGKVYDNNGTTNSLIYSAEVDILATHGGVSVHASTDYSYNTSSKTLNGFSYSGYTTLKIAGNTSYRGDNYGQSDGTGATRMEIYINGKNVKTYYPNCRGGLDKYENSSINYTFDLSGLGITTVTSIMFKAYACWNLGACAFSATTIKLS